MYSFQQPYYSPTAHAPTRMACIMRHGCVAGRWRTLDARHHRATAGGGGEHRAPSGPVEPRPRVLAERGLPTPPTVRGSKSLYLTEADLLDVSGEWVVQILRVGVSTEDMPIHARPSRCCATAARDPPARAGRFGRRRDRRPSPSLGPFQTTFAQFEAIVKAGCGISRLWP